MRKDFRDFILKGNLLQLAVAFIMGAAAIYYISFINTMVTVLIIALVIFWLIRVARGWISPLKQPPQRRKPIRSACQPSHSQNPVVHNAPQS